MDLPTKPIPTTLPGNIDGAEPKAATGAPPHGHARVICGETCVIAWWESGKNESTPSIKASAVEVRGDHWRVYCSIDGGNSLYSEMEVWGGSRRKARAICRALVASLRGVIGRHCRCVTSRPGA